MIGIILASGSSKRLGRNKLLEKINGKYIIEHVVLEALKVDFTELILVYKDKEIYELFKGFKIKLLYNKNHLLGQSESIKLAIKNISNSDEPMMFLVGDQPLLKNKTIKNIINHYSSQTDIIIPRIHKTNRMPTIFGPKYKKEFLEIKGDVGGRVLIKKHMNDVTFIDLESELEYQFFDVDTEENLEFIKKIIIKL